MARTSYLPRSSHDPARRRGTVGIVDTGPPGSAREGRLAGGAHDRQRGRGAAGKTPVVAAVAFMVVVIAPASMRSPCPGRSTTASMRLLLWVLW